MSAASRPRRRGLATLAVAVLVLAWSAPSVAPASAQADAPDRLLVRWADGVGAVQRDAVLDGWRATLADAELDGRASTSSDAVRRERLTDRIDAVVVPGADAAVLADAADGLQRHALIDLAEPDRVVTVRSTAQDRSIVVAPDDTLFELQWGLRNTGQRFESATGIVDAVAGVDVRGLEAWAVTRGSPEVRVAVIDTAVEASHPDLVGALVAAVSTREGSNGDPAPGMHGTAVSGVIAARADDGFGIAGLAPEVSIVSVSAFEQLLGNGSSTTISSIVAGFDAAAAAGAAVVNASWVTSDPSLLLFTAVADIGVPVVAATGNDGAVLTEDANVYPAGFDLPNVLAVTAVGPDGRVPAFANIGAGLVDIAAPGTLVAAPGLDGRHVWAEGTSFAAPFVTAAVALAIDIAPYASVADVVDAVRWTSRPLPSLDGAVRTGGMLDAAALVHGVQRPVCRPDLLPAASFDDVEAGATHADAIRCVAATGVALGTDEGTFESGEAVTRAQFASFLARVLVLAGIDPDDPVLPADGEEDAGDDPGADDPATDTDDTASGTEDTATSTDDTATPTDDTATGTDDTATSTDDTASGTDDPGADDPATDDPATDDPATDDTATSTDDPATDDAATSTDDTATGTEDTDGFDDVDPDNVHAAAIDLLAQLGIVQGGTDGRFRPDETVTRGQLASVLVRTQQALTATDLEPSRRWFADTADSVHADAADTARDLGIVRGVTRETYVPDAATTRGQLASFLARSMDALARGGVDLG